MIGQNPKRSFFAERHQKHLGVVHQVAMAISLPLFIQMRPRQEWEGSSSSYPRKAPSLGWDTTVMLTKSLQHNRHSCCSASSWYQQEMRWHLWLACSKVRMSNVVGLVCLTSNLAWFWPLHVNLSETLSLTSNNLLNRCFDLKQPWDQLEQWFLFEPFLEDHRGAYRCSLGAYQQQRGRGESFTRAPTHLFGPSMAPVLKEAVLNEVEIFLLNLNWTFWMGPCSWGWLVWFFRGGVPSCDNLWVNFEITSLSKLNQRRRCCRRRSKKILFVCWMSPCKLQFESLGLWWQFLFEFSSNTFTFLHKISFSPPPNNN